MHVNGVDAVNDHAYVDNDVGAKVIKIIQSNVWIANRMV